MVTVNNESIIDCNIIIVHMTTIIIIFRNKLFMVVRLSAAMLKMTECQEHVESDVKVQMIIFVIF